jgi:hypothetical protein
LTKGNATNMPNERPLPSTTRPQPPCNSMRDGASISVPGCRDAPKMGVTAPN